MAEQLQLEKVASQGKRSGDSRSEQEALLDLAPVLVRDPDDRIIRWTRGMEHLYGWTCADALGRVSHELLQTQFPEPLADIRARLLRDGRWEGELTHTRRDGRQVAVASQWVVYNDGVDHPVAILEVNNDITAARAMAAALHQSEEEYRQIFEMSAVGIAQVELDGRWRRVNQRLCDIVGYPREELRRLTFQEITHPDDLNTDLAWVDKLLAGEMNTYDMEKRYVRKDGKSVWIHLTVSLVRAPSGEPDYFISIIEDVSRRKELEDQVRRNADELQRRVEERTRDLQEANAALEAFGYSVSHDLRTPLRNMQSLAQALEEDYGDRLDAGGRDFCRRITGAARKMDALINDLLAYSRISRSDLAPGNVDLGAVLAECASALEETIQQTGAQLDVHGPLPVVLAHRTTLVQIVTNLLGNALKFVAPGVRPRVRVWAEDRGACVRLWVEDNGVGIAPEHRERIFQVFERLHGEETYPGTGIGLAIVRKGVERMGGKVGLESEVGRGSCFWLDLPGRRDTTCP